MSKTVFITGGSRGIGKAIADKFLQMGYVVTAPARSELDLADPVSVEAYIKAHADKSFDVIINNAGINDISFIENVTDASLERMIQVNLISPIRLLRGLIEKMKENRYGRIVNIGSIWAAVSKPGRGVYSAAKHGIHGITNTLALELGEYNILINTVCPGFTITEMTDQNNTEEQIQDICKNIPLGRMAQPEEIAELVFFLGSDKNTYITGQKILIDGGFTVI